MAARAKPRTVAAIARDVTGSADMLEAAAHGIALQAQGLFSGDQNLEHCMLAVYYERVEREADVLRALAAELTKGAGLDGGGR